jgi:hypothetical protein
LKRTYLPLHGGAIRANLIGSFVMGGENFHVIRPGYCSQGKRRLTWTQIVHEDVPIFEVKFGSGELVHVFDRFETMWKRTIGDDRDLLARALTACKAARRRKFKDGVSGEAPAPSAALDKRGEGRRYTA